MRHVKLPIEQLLSIKPHMITIQLSEEDAKWLKIYAEGMEKTLLNSIEEELNKNEGNIDMLNLDLYNSQLPWWHRIKESIKKG